MKSTVVYTAIIGSRDKLHDPPFKSDADYVCFTDQDLTSDVWEIRKVKSHRPAVEFAKRYKMLPHWFFPEYEKSVWIDANMLPLVDITKNKHLLCVYEHPVRNCVYKEAKEVIRQRLADPEVVEAQMAHYREDGYPENVGLSTCYVIYRRHDYSDVKAFGEAWYKECNKWCWRDQLSFDYLVWSHNKRALYPSDNWRWWRTCNSGYGKEDSDFERITHGK